MTIHLLDDLTINQMAAGEVIESTASVIKELVENSLDAQATSIEVEIQAGGRSYMRVSDNGQGILHDEVPKAILRHATSKLKTFSDLQFLNTLGFRGEALASIASISKLSITTAATAPSNSTPNGTYFVHEGNQLITYVPVFREKGTTIEVKDLFFNTPVRKTFLRSSLFDTQEIVKVLTHIALGFPEVALRLIADKKTVIDLYSTDLKSRTEELLGKNFVDQSTDLVFEKKGIRVNGLIGSPKDHRHNRMGQYFLLNRRTIFSPFISSSIREGYGHSLPEGRHPQFVLHLVIDPKEVDVNVHPKKTEARFRTKGTLSHSLTLAVQSCLFKQTAPKESGAPLTSHAATSRERPFSRDLLHTFATYHRNVARVCDC
jgi:DNA mismatch repair protein MutL